MYRVTIDRERCIACGIVAGRCPTHSRVLARILDQQSEDATMLTGIFSQELYARVKRAAESCPVKAIIIEMIGE